MPSRPWLRPLPLLLLAAMLAIAVVLELVLFRDAALLAKTPLAALLAAALWRGRRARRAA